MPKEVLDAGLVAEVEALCLHQRALAMKGPNEWPALRNNFLAHKTTDPTMLRLMDYLASKPVLSPKQAITNSTQELKQK